MRHVGDGRSTSYDEAPPTSSEAALKLFSSKRRVALMVLIVLALFLIRPGASRLKSRIIFSMSASVARPVDIGAVHIRLLPRPGFDLDNLVVYDDPAFGAEPMLRASEVTAYLRLTSLVRGRLEVARLEVTEPSLNLVHEPDGKWNLETLLERTAHLPLAPTGKAKSEPRPAFPYIACTSGRINFKIGPVKKPYALTNADFSLWQESENAWGVRLKAQPFRGDLNLNDTGEIKVNGTWQRAERFRDTPMEFRMEWSRAQLGQLTKFFTGNDKGWRGAIQLDVTMAGTPANLRLSSDTALEDFRRYDITSGNALHLAGHCDAEYSNVSHEFQKMMCNAPVGNGLVTLTGEMGLPGSHRYSIAVTADGVPASAGVMMAQRAKKNLPEDLAAQGKIHGSFTLQEDSGSGSKAQFTGRGEIIDFHLTSVAEKAEIGPVTLPFLLVDGSASGAHKQTVRSSTAVRFPDGPHLEIGPFAIGTGHSSVPTVRGWVNRGGYTFSLAGEADAARALRLARMAGVPALPLNVEGTAQVALQIADSWAGGDGTVSGFRGPELVGTAKLRNVRLAVRGTGDPIVISSADVEWAQDKIHVTKLNAAVAGSTWTGWVETPRGCSTADTCPARFAVNTSQVALSQLHEWISPSTTKRPWYRVLEPSGQSGSPLLSNLRASGRVTADRFESHGVIATRVSANVSLKKGDLQITELTADVLGGKYSGAWQADFSAKPATCGGTGSLSGISLSRVADAMNDSWISGTANADYEVKGPCPSEFWESAEGTLRVDVRDGVLSHLIIGADGEPFRLTHLNGHALLRTGRIEVTDAKLDTPDGKYQLSGTASLKRDVNLKLTRMVNGIVASGYAISGTLGEPRVSPLPGAEQARLK